MARGKGRYNKDCERSRQEKKQINGKYGSLTAMRLRKKLTGEDRSEEMKADYNNILQNHYNACYSDFAKKTLKKNHGFVERNCEDENFEDHNLQKLGEVDVSGSTLVFYSCQCSL